MGVKVTFDPATRIIQIDKAPVLDGDDWVVDIDAKIDLYSDGKEDWLSDADLNKLQFAMASSGGDPKPGGALGATFFMEHDWKIRPYEGDHWLRIDGNLFARDGSNPFVKTVGDYNVVITQNVSDIVEVVTPDLGDVASAVWSHADAVFLKDIEGGRWEIVANQMIFYKADNITEVARFNLFDVEGSPTMENVYERKRVVEITEDLSTYIEVNSGGYISKTSDRVTFTEIPVDLSSDGYLYKDFGEGFFGDFSVDFDWNISVMEGSSWSWAVVFSNSLGTWWDNQEGANGVAYGIQHNLGRFWLLAHDFASTSSQGMISPLLAVPTGTVYARFTRSGLAGIVSLYSDAERSMLIGIASRLFPATAYRYFFPFVIRGVGSPILVTGYAENFILTL